MKIRMEHPKATIVVEWDDNIVSKQYADVAHLITTAMRGIIEDAKGWQVILIGYDTDRKIFAIKGVRSVTGASLTDAKKWIETVDTHVLGNFKMPVKWNTKREAQDAVTKLCEHNEIARIDREA